ncbi:hypothetical protein ABTH15_19335, partial [Acinetobacter baumannii]
AGFTAAGVLAAAPAVHAASVSAAQSANAAKPASAPSTTSADADLLAPMLGALKIGNPMPDLPDCADKRTPDGTDVTAVCVEVRGDGAMRQVG